MQAEINAEMADYLTYLSMGKLDAAMKHYARASNLYFDHVRRGGR